MVYILMIKKPIQCNEMVMIFCENYYYYRYHTYSRRINFSFCFPYKLPIDSYLLLVVKRFFIARLRDSRSETNHFSGDSELMTLFFAQRVLMLVSFSFLFMSLSFASSWCHHHAELHCMLCLLKILSETFAFIIDNMDVKAH